MVRGLGRRPDFAALAELHPRGTIVTAPGRTADFVSRYFAPSYGVPEDPVTGANHCMLAPFWGDRLGKRRLVAHQASARGGDMICTVSDTRVALTGEAHLFLHFSPLRNVDFARYCARTH